MHQSVIPKQPIRTVTPPDPPKDFNQWANYIHKKLGWKQAK